MKRILKALLFPVILLLTIAVVIFRAVNGLSNMLLSLLAFLIFLLGLAVMLVLRDTAGGWQILGIALLFSPFGLPLIVTFMIELLGFFKDLLKAI